MDVFAGFNKKCLGICSCVGLHFIIDQLKVLQCSNLTKKYVFLRLLSSAKSSDQHLLKINMLEYYNMLPLAHLVYSL